MQKTRCQDVRCKRTECSFAASRYQVLETKSPLEWYLPCIDSTLL